MTGFLASIRMATLVLWVMAATVAAHSTAAASSKPLDGFLETLSTQDRAEFEAYYAAMTFHRAAVDAYWAKVSAMRTQRRARLRRGGKATPRDYVTEFPPEYKGPRASKRLLKLWAAYQSDGRRPQRRRTTYPTAADYIALAERYYGFKPERVPEREFKRRYAAEALRLGLTKRQVVRVYALETGGYGTADMVAGVSPRHGRGRPISTALGYAQLLAANTVNVLQSSGSTFVKRLQTLRNRANDPDRIAKLDAKIVSLRKMLRVANAIPKRWSAQRKLARTARGRGMHAINIDGDIGPWLQVRKLRGVRDYGTRAGYTSLKSEQLELMNLAGPGTGLEMMTPTGMKMPTSNFFSRLGYERNSVVRGRTSAELLEALGERMDRAERNPGAREFAEVFGELLAAR